MQTAKSIVINCAGIGSRLGLNTTKSLLRINGKTIIQRQLEYFKDFDDIRIVVGFQAKQVMQEVLKYRKDVVFVYNHNYFNTKTGASYYLGAKDGGKYAIEVDGDLLIHPDDIHIIKNAQGEWLAYSDISSNDSVFVNIEKSNKGDDFAVSFSYENGMFEWTGPCCVEKNKLTYNKIHNVFDQLIPYLPIKAIKIRAYDIDTYEDYIKVSNIVKTWDNKLCKEIK